MPVQINLRSGGIVLGILGAAAGLNLSVLGLGVDPSPEEATDATADNEVIQVPFDVTIPAPPPETVAPLTAPPAAPAAPQVVYVQVPAAAPAAVPVPPPTTAAPPATTATTAPTTAAGPVTEYLYYDFEAVASEIIIAYHDNRSLEFWSVTAEPGWAYFVEKDTASVVEIKFERVEGAEGEAKFELVLEDGDLQVKKEL